MGHLIACGTLAKSAASQPPAGNSGTDTVKDGTRKRQIKQTLGSLRPQTHTYTHVHKTNSTAELGPTCPVNVCISCALPSEMRGFFVPRVFRNHSRAVAWRWPNTVHGLIIFNFFFTMFRALVRSISHRVCAVCVCVCKLFIFQLRCQPRGGRKA